MSDPADTSPLSRARLRADLRRRLWPEWAALLLVVVVSSLPILLTDALPLTLRGLPTSAEVTGPATVTGTGRSQITQLPVAFTDAAGRTHTASLPAPLFGPRAPGSRLMLRYLPEAPWRATLTPVLFAVFAALPLVTGLAALAWARRTWRREVARRLRPPGPVGRGRRTGKR
jgi:hypothetical protein